ncbi:hypothetical protein CEP54_015919 [Fusarium duplospermum]|uniref:Uncharacterized protein n=1 Tax=Fusarium duplospermum TaxID=1325734 RepID=A0A428NK04_9HYPO|nr:hypothetical protein CEP54_015919 [Fusarium duplospermum]
MGEEILPEGSRKPKTASSKPVKLRSRAKLTSVSNHFAGRVSALLSVQHACALQKNHDSKQPWPQEGGRLRLGPPLRLRRYLHVVLTKRSCRPQKRLDRGAKTLLPEQDLNSPPLQLSPKSVKSNF